MSVFISYSSCDEEYATILERALSTNKIETWFAPKDIDSGKSFVARIGNELSTHQSSDPEGRIEEDQAHLKTSQYFIMLLSANSMKSKWVRREFLLADRKNLPMMILHIDHSSITDEFETLLIDTQITEAYRLRPKAMQAIVTKVLREVSAVDGVTIGRDQEQRLTYEEIGIFPIASGDPFYIEGDTLRITLGSGEFFLAPPAVLLTNKANREYAESHHFHFEDIVFDLTLDQLCAQVPIENIGHMIESSRHKVFQQFLSRENGCYFNNQKYGVSSISRFERTENMAELPMLRMEMYLTDYYTHRVMKDVCKKLAASQSSFIRGLDFNRIGPERILFTSLGVNLVLSESTSRVLLTSRSINAAETYKRHNYSVSAIEGVSISDYDTFKQSVNVEYAVLRGLQEELGVDDSYIRKDSLKFYDLFINPANLEMGLSCSLELKPEYSLAGDIVPLRGKDEQLEVSEKKIIDTALLESFVRNNYASMIPQAVYTLCTFMETIGVFMLNRQHRKLLRDSTTVIAKNGTTSPCGDSFVWCENYIAVIDGATPKGEMLWDGQPGDIFVSRLVADAIQGMAAFIEAHEAISFLNSVVRKAYENHGVDFESLLPAERLQCSVLIYSVSKHEVWSFGDCMLRINSRDLRNIKETDELFASLRAFCIQIERDRRGGAADERELSEFGREMILPYLRDSISLANRNVPFGYDVLDGGPINVEHTKVYAVQKDDHVVMASDGYPKLFDTLEDTEEYLKQALLDDPCCIDILRGTKGVAAGNESYDDRTYVSFSVR